MIFSILKSKLRYSQTACYLSCYQISLVEKCNCYDLAMPYWPILNSTKPCLTYNDIICDQSEFSKFFSQDVKKICSNECPLECETMSYSTSVSSLSYPSEAYASALMKNPKVQAKFGDNTSAITYERLKKTLVALNIYYETLSYKKLIEVEKLNFVDLIANIGGTLGLFLGMSFLSFIELIDLIIHIGLALSKSKRADSSQTAYEI
jgi:hypothetical protein